MEVKKTLCQLAKEKNIEELKNLATGAKYICPVCFRVSNDLKRICSNAQQLGNKGIFKKMLSKIDAKLEEKSNKRNCCDKNSGCC